MKKTNIRIIAVAAAIVMMTALFPACVPYGSGSEDVPTADPNIGSEELQPLVLQKASAFSVNMLTSIARVYYAGSNTVLTEKDMDIEIKAYKIDGNEQTELAKDDFKYEVDEDGYIRVESPEIGKISLKVTAKASGNTAEAEIRVLRRTLTVWDIIILGIGLYAFIAGVSGRGRLYEEQFVKEGMESKHHTAVRASALVVSILMIASAIVASIDKYGRYTSIKTILFGAGVLAFIVAFIITDRMIDKKARKEYQEKAGHDMKAPDSAFDFDENEPTVDDISKS